MRAHLMFSLAIFKQNHKHRKYIKQNHKHRKYIKVISESECTDNAYSRTMRKNVHVQVKKLRLLNNDRRGPLIRVALTTHTLHRLIVF